MVAYIEVDRMEHTQDIVSTQNGRLKEVLLYSFHDLLFSHLPMQLIGLQVWYWEHELFIGVIDGT